MRARDKVDIKNGIPYGSFGVCMFDEFIEEAHGERLEDINQLGND